MAVAHGGNPAEDIARLLATSTVSAVRKAHLGTILAHYYDALCQAMPEPVGSTLPPPSISSSPPSIMQPPFGLAELWRGYVDILPYATVFFLFGVPMMSKTPQIMGPPSSTAAAQ